MKLIQHQDYKVMPWKNGLGLTSEIEIFPQFSDISKNNFLWRLSCAQIQTNNNFSCFKGYDRILTVWSGRGLLLNQVKLEPLYPIRFEGESEIHCKLISGDVDDLGIIYKRGEVKAEMSIMTFSILEKIQTVFSQMAFIFYFVCKEN